MRQIKGSEDRAAFKRAEIRDPKTKMVVETDIDELYFQRIKATVTPAILNDHWNSMTKKEQDSLIMAFNLLNSADLDDLKKQLGLSAEASQTSKMDQTP